MTFRPPLYMQNSDLFSYSAADDRFLVDTLFSEGIVNVASGQGLAVQRPDGANMSVYVPPFDAIVKGDDASLQGSYLLRMVAAEFATVTGAPASGSRIDLLVAEIVDSTYRTITAGTPEGPRLRVIAGTAAASNPATPTLPATAIPIASFPVAAGQTSILTTSITDLRTQSGAASLKIGTQAVAMTAAQRDALTLGPSDAGRLIYNTTTGRPEVWTGVAWIAWGGTINSIVYTSSGSTTVPADVTSMEFELLGGGGAGGSGGNVSTANARAGGSGGGAGGHRRARVPVTPGSTVSFTVGAGGTASTPSGSTGLDGPSGSDSTLTIGGTTITAPGGRGGAANGTSPGRYAGRAVTDLVNDGTAVNSGDGGISGSGVQYARSGSPIGPVCGGAGGGYAATSGTIVGYGGEAGTPTRPALLRADSRSGTGNATDMDGSSATSSGCGGGGGGSASNNAASALARGGKGGNGAPGQLTLTWFGKAS